MGWEVYPEGFYQCIKKAAEYGVPVYITENGIGTDDDSQRAEYLRRGLEITAEAIGRVDVRGFFHWTGVDNYEWLHGYDVSFGIIDRERRVRGSARVLTEAALGG